MRSLLVGSLVCLCACVSPEQNGDAGSTGGGAGVTGGGTNSTGGGDGASGGGTSSTGGGAGVTGGGTSSTGGGAGVTGGGTSSTGGGDGASGGGTSSTGGGDGATGGGTTSTDAGTDLDAGSCLALNEPCRFPSDCCTGVCGMNALCATPGVEDGRDCAHAAELVFTATGTTSVMGSTVDAGRDYSPNSLTCAGLGPDRVYRFTVDAGAVANFSLWADYLPTLSFNGSSSSCPGPILACQYFPSNLLNTAAEVAGVALTPGTYWVWVDSYDGGGTFALEGSVTPLLDPLGESCASPLPLTFSGSTAAIDGSTRGRVNDARSWLCGGGRGDLVYRFELSDAGSVTASVTGHTAGFAPIVYVRSDCGGADLGCAQLTSHSVPVSLTLTLDAGSYFLWVDGTQDGQSVDGDFTLTLTR